MRSAAATSTKSTSWDMVLIDWAKSSDQFTYNYYNLHVIDITHMNVDKHRFDMMTVRHLGVAKITDLEAWRSSAI